MAPSFQKIYLLVLFAPICLLMSYPLDKGGLRAGERFGNGTESGLHLPPLDPFHEPGPTWWEEGGVLQAR